MVKSRKELAVFLSKLKVFESPKRQLEQYATDSEIASLLLWQAYQQGDILDKTVLDLGAGTGILGIGALILGAKHVEFLDIDASVYLTIKENLEMLTDNWEIDLTDRWSFTNVNCSAACAKVDTVIMNPPFGTSNKHADKGFLKASMKIAPRIYSMHKTSTKGFVQSFSRDNNLQIVWEKDVLFPLKPTMGEHKKRLERIEVTLFCFDKK